MGMSALGQHFDLRLLIDRDAAQFSVILDEVHSGHADEVVRRPLGGQASDERLHLTNRAGDCGGPGPPAHAHGLRDSDTVAGLQVLMAHGRFHALTLRRSHSPTLPARPPRTRAMRPVRASSRMPYGRDNSMKASIFCSRPLISTIRF